VTDQAEMDIRRGDAAERIMNDELVKEALFRLRAECVEQWEQTPVRDTEGRERLWTMYRLAQKFEAHFRALIESGQLASRRVADLEAERKMWPFGR
jgi:hypothetical protein